MHCRVALDLDGDLGYAEVGVQRADLGEVVGKNTMSCPDLGAFGAVDAGAVPAVSAFKGADPGFASGPPFHRFPEYPTAFLGMSGLIHLVEIRIKTDNNAR